jgi:hypothetical protein
MLALISLRFFAQSGHIDAFRSIVGEGTGGRNIFSALPQWADHQFRAHPTLRFEAGFAWFLKTSRI